LEETPQIMHCDTWEQWSETESERRTKLIVFCFLNVHSIAYDMPPSIWCDEIKLKLPCSCPEWTAPDATSWDMLRKATTPNEQGYFNDALDILMSGTKQVDPNIATVSPVGNYTLCPKVWRHSEIYSFDHQLQNLITQQPQRIKTYKYI
jgi:hypothetical protein